MKMCEVILDRFACEFLQARLQLLPLLGLELGHAVDDAFDQRIG